MKRQRRRGAYRIYTFTLGTQYKPVLMSMSKVLRPYCSNDNAYSESQFKTM